MSEKTPSAIKYFGIVDIIVVVFFLSTAAYSIYLFRADLMQTLDTRDEEPAGYILIRDNIVQRRFADRVIWDRLFVNSPVYSGDLIRAADLSSATIDMENNQLSLSENSLIRIQQGGPGGRGSFHVDLQSGNLSLATSSEGKGIQLNLMGRQVQTGAGTVLNVESGEDGIMVQVNSGSAAFVGEGQVRELTEGTMVAQNRDGTERIIPSAVVTSPRPGARYLKGQPEPLPVDFVWKSVNLDAGETLRLEFANDRNFTRNVYVIENVTDRTQAAFEAGVWHWRLVWGDAVLRTGQLTVADATGPEPVSPAKDSVFRYQKSFPQVRFQWSEKPGADRYVLEISETPDFVNPKSRQSSAASLILSNLGAGTWHWRVRPVFPSAYIGEASYSEASSFRIEQNSDPAAAAIVVPDKVPPPAPAGPRVMSARPEPGRNYTVRSGDFLSRIAIRAYGTVSGITLIIAENNIRNPNLIYVGQVLYIPVYKE